MASYNKSYETTLSRLLELSRKVLPDFTNYVDDDPLVILIKLMSMLSVSSNSYSNKYLNSKYIQQIKDVDTKSMYTLLESFNMMPKPIIPGTIDVTFEYTGTNIDDQLIVPQGTKFSVGDIQFTILESYYMKALNTFLSMTIVEGEYKTEEFTGNLISNNRLKLDSTKVSMDYVSVIVDDKEYTKVENCKFLSGTEIFGVEYSIDQEYYVVFPKNYIESITETSKIIINYIESTGSTDYDPLEQDISISSEIIYNGNDVSSSFNLYTVSGYRYGDTSHNELNNYKKLSSILSTFGYAIVTADYESLVNYYPGVAISAAYDINSEKRLDPDINIQVPFLTKIVIAPQVGYYMTQYLRSDISEYLNRVGISDKDLHFDLLDPKYVVIDLTVGIKSTNIKQSDLLNTYSNVSSAIRDYFKLGNIKFGSYISKDYVSTLIAKSDSSIQYVDLLDFNGYQLKANELPVLGKLEILFSYNSLALTDEVRLLESENNVEATHYLQGARGENMSFVDKLSSSAGGGVQFELMDESSFESNRYFGYDSNFTIRLTQELTINTSDRANTTGRVYTCSAKSALYTTYETDSVLDSDNALDDTPRTAPKSLVTDRAYPFKYDYLF